MTERFTIIYNEHCEMMQYVDTQKEEPNRWAIWNANETAQKLNQLNNKNEQLKKRNKRLEGKIQRERTSFTKTHERWSKEAETKIKELSEENERLKKDIEYYKTERLALFEYLEKKDDLKLELKVKE